MAAVKLSQWARDNAMHYQTALTQFHKGQVPGARRLPSGRIVVDVEDPAAPARFSGGALYARVSTRKQAAHLDAQLARLRGFAAAQGVPVVAEVSEIASGVSDRRPKLRQLLRDSTFDTLYVEYPDRLARFGRGWIELLLETQGRKVVYLNQASDGDEESLAEDLITLVASFCGRMYGKRGGKAKTDAVAGVLGAED